jgi:Ca-activated chloride channel homolog
MKRTTLGLVAMGCMLASSAAALAVPLPDRTSAVALSDLGPVPLTETATKKAQISVGKTVMLDARLGHEALGQNGSGETYLFAQVTGSETAAVGQAPPVNLGIVIDRSGSMKGERIAHAMDAASVAVERMRDGDMVSVVAFDTRSDVIVPPTVVGPDTRRSIESRIRGIRLGGDTCISCGLESAMHELMNGQKPTDGVSRMLLLSDGATNSGIRDIPGLRNLAARMRDRGCTISTIGVDVDFDEKVMAAIANEANGRHYFVRNAAGLSNIFTQEFDSLVASVARDGELQLTLAPGVEVDQVFDRAFRREGDKIIVPFGSVSKGQQKTVLMKLRMPVGSAGQKPVADLKLVYRDLVDRTDGSCGGTLALDVREGASDPSLDPFVAARLERSRTAQTLTQVNLLVEGGKIDEARQQLAGRRAELKKAETLALAQPLKDKAGAPRAARSLDRDFEEQLGAVASAESFGGAPTGGASGGGGFAHAPGKVAGPSAAPPAPASPASKGSVRTNQQNAADLAF